VINGQNGVQSHTETIWKLLEYYHLPVFVFVNKMDIAVDDQDQLMKNLEKMLSGNCICFNLEQSQLYEKIAMSDEKLLDKYMNDQLNQQDVRNAINQRRIFPCYFGSALKDQGIEELMKGLHEYCVEREYLNQLALRVFKVGYDDNGTRLCYCRILGEALLSKEKINENDKVDQIYLLNGTKSTLLQKAEPGMVVAVKGLDGFIAGQSIGLKEDERPAVLTAYMNYRVILPPHTDTNMMMKQLSILAEEDPQLTVSYQQELKEIHLQLMGEIQLEIIRNIILKRTGVTIDFDNGKVLFKETILNTVTGVGHFEPLRHYAEVVLRLQPLPLNSGLVFESEASTDDLAGNWQNLIMTHLKEKQHRGVLTGSPITDMKITLVAGRAHLKHTEGGDFRQATYRAVRQGLKKADSIILEPYYDFTITVDNAHLSKVLYDIETMNGTVSVQQLSDGLMEVKGNAPVRKMQNYQTTLASYTSGKGRIMMEMSGYQPCRSQDEIIAMFNYDSERDFSNPTGSVFCAHGSGFYVPYDLVEQY
ncbi:MAG: TetM/TetW/TetO/TetS family tetracycline resistance ribosomal protection protein, partial [Erysipelotrichaceae bacterium]|nr:TetM/TetW/TetO/TetS family tetracycline resistance ribosomal protection protein [Erysipelotrichaceae bacterium]